MTRSKDILRDVPIGIDASGGLDLGGYWIQCAGMRIVRTTVAEATAKALREMIVAGDLRAGDALRQEELAAKLGVSRTPLREAIARLDSEGLVVNDPHKGAVVYRPTLEGPRSIGS